MRPSRALGIAGEDAVAAWYEANGYQVLARNWRSGRDGELDIVARKGSTYVFCEVKTRSSVAFGAPIEAVGSAKQRRIHRLAARWMAQSAARPRGDLRFDIASVLRGTVDVTEGCF